MVDGISPLNKLQASQAYRRVDAKEFTDGIENFTGEAVNFAADKHNNFNSNVNKVFNAYSQMTPEQILARIKNSPAVMPQNSVAGQILNSISKPIKTAEVVTKKALIGEASLVDLTTATTNMGITVETVIALRDNVIRQLDKIFSMQI